MEREHLVKLRQILVERFDEGELRTLCFDLGVKYDALPGAGTENKARELIAYLERRDRIPQLIETGKRFRPDIAWDDAYLEDRLNQLRARRDQADKARREMRTLCDHLRRERAFGQRGGARRDGQDRPCQPRSGRLGA